MMIQLRRVGGLVISIGDSSFSDSKIHKFGRMGAIRLAQDSKNTLLRYSSWIHLGASKKGVDRKGLDSCSHQDTQVWNRNAWEMFFFHGSCVQQALGRSAGLRAMNVSHKPW